MAISWTLILENTVQNTAPELYMYGFCPDIIFLAVLK